MPMVLDCRGDMCPIPVIKTKKALDEAGENSVISVWTDTPEAVENIAKMTEGRGHAFTITERDTYYEIVITKGSGMIPEANTPLRNDSVIVIASDRMGEGDDTLGATLLKTFIYTLTESEILPQALIFYNGGVKLTTEGSAVLRDLQILTDMGVDIISCGACLKYYGLTDALKAGRITNMYEIAALMLKYRVVKP